MIKRKSTKKGIPEIQSIRTMGIPSEEAFGTTNLLLYYSFAPDWFADALNEARRAEGASARRREILFAVCFTDSYMVEWVRDEVLKRDFKRFIKYFPLRMKMPVYDKWMNVPKELHRDGLIVEAPDWSDQTWNNWLTLIEYRDGLVHAVSSLPETSSQQNDEKPKPSKTDLDQMEAGWPVKVIVALVRQLHKAVGTLPPAWIEEP